jgi:hypothetical protein
MQLSDRNSILVTVAVLVVILAAVGSIRTPGPRAEMAYSRAPFITGVSAD